MCELNNYKQFLGCNGSTKNQGEIVLFWKKKFYIDHFQFYNKISSLMQIKKAAIMITCNLKRKKSWRCHVSLSFVVLRLFNSKVFKELQHENFGSIKQSKIKVL